MSMPRRAMKEMGLEACCLWCDAPDVASLQRCTSCIGHHKFIRDKIAKSPPDDAMAQFGKELMIKAGAPHKHDHLEEHGPVLLEQQKRAAALVGEVKRSTQEEVEAVFVVQAQRKKTNIIKDVGNQNQWKEQAPSVEQAKDMGQLFFSGEQQNNAHARTNPSKPIPEVDRSDRLGEDLDLAYRLEAQKENITDELLIDLEVEEKLEMRKSYKDTLADLDELFDD